jgi:hypothetical protein
MREAIGERNSGGFLRPEPLKTEMTAPGEMTVVRYADDTIVGFQFEDDARRFLDELHERLRAFAPTLRPEKTP